MVQVSTRVIFGTPEAVATRLAYSPVSSTVNTSFVERDNLTQRQSNRRSLLLDSRVVACEDVLY